jgi:hypothetical protein
LQPLHPAPHKESCLGQSCLSLLLKHCKHCKYRSFHKQFAPSLTALGRIPDRPVKSSERKLENYLSNDNRRRRLANSKAGATAGVTFALGGTNSLHPLSPLSAGFLTAQSSRQPPNAKVTPAVALAVFAAFAPSAPQRIVSRPILSFSFTLCA